MGKVHRKGVAAQAKKANKRHRRNCRSAPAVPTGLTVQFRRREMGKRNRWRAHVDWNPVTEDVAGRAINPEAYQVQQRATDASGDPVETKLQDESLTANGEDFAVHAGSAPVHTTNPKQKNARELNASPDEIKKTLTGLTAGIPVQVNFYAMEDTAGSAPVLKFRVWNVTDGTEVASKNQAIDGVFPKLYVTRTFTPVAGKTYEARVSWVSGTGVALFHHIQWFSPGNAAVWNKVIPAETASEDTEHNFAPLPHPKTWYFQHRVRVMNRHGGARCWSAWTAWTTPINPGHLTYAGPPPPTNVTQVIDKVEGKRGSPWRVRTRWNETPWWIPPDGDAEEGADRYVVELAVSNDAGATTANTRSEVISAAMDVDGNSTAQFSWTNKILGKRYYRSRVRAIQGGRRGAFSAWTAWASPGGTPSPPVSVTWSNPTPRVLVAKWSDPTDKTEVDRYRVRVFRQPGAVLVDDGFTSGNRWVYAIPKADRDNAHKVRVNSVSDPVILDRDDVAPSGWDTQVESSNVESSDLSDTAPLIADIHNAADNPIIRAVTGPPKWLVTYNSAQNIAHDTLTFIRWGTEVTDTDSFYTNTTGTDNLNATATSDYAFTIPFAGDYHIGVTLDFGASSAGYRVVAIWTGASVATATNYDSASTNPHATTSTRFYPGPFYLAGMPAGHQVIVACRQTSGGLLALVAAKCWGLYLGAGG